MEPQRQQDLWAIAIENYQAARLTAQHEWHNVSVACSYYAVFTAMWVALGDPLKDRWRHEGIIQHFALGSWRSPPAPIATEMARAIRRLYTNRLKADYRVTRLTPHESMVSLTTARQILHFIAGERGLSQGGIMP
jgi:uncharacterized protein (UPF0332 family)